MLKWLSDWRVRRAGARMIDTGFGPFSKRALQAIRDSMCSRCGIPISEFTLFGNALVIQNGGVHCWCSRCRTGTNYELYLNHPFNARHRIAGANQTIDRCLIIGEIAELMKYNSTAMTWLDVILCMRGGVGGFQKYTRKRFDGFSRNRAERERLRYGRLVPGSCAECGALWANEWQMQHGQMHRERLSNQNCRACGFPNDQQWFMRSTLDQEEAQL